MAGIHVYLNCVKQWQPTCVWDLYCNHLCDCWPNSNFSMLMKFALATFKTESVAFQLITFYSWFYKILLDCLPKWPLNVKHCEGRALQKTILLIIQHIFDMKQACLHNFVYFFWHSSSIFFLGRSPRWLAFIWFKISDLHKK